MLPSCDRLLPAARRLWRILLVERDQAHRVLLVDHQIASAAARQMPYSNLVSSCR